MKIPIETKRFINAVTNPFDCGEAARIPDNDAQMSMPFKDYSINNGYSMTVTATTTVAYGAAIYLIIGANRLTEATIIPSKSYSVVITLFDAAGVDIGTEVIPTYNYTNIINMALFYRHVGCGIRVKCLIEDVTVSTTVAVSRMYAGLIKPQDLYTVFNSNLSIYSVAQQMDCVKAYDNSQGATVRFDPFQQIVDFKKYRSQADWQSYYTFNGNTYAQPLIACQFMNPLVMTTTSGNSTYSIPLIIESIFWIEGLLQKPSPLFLTPSPTDLNYEKICEVLSTSCETVFPIVTKFNSFQNFMTSLGRLGFAVNNAVQKSSFLPAARMALKAWNGSPRRYRKQPRKQPNRGGRRRKKNFKPRKFVNAGNKKNFRSARLYNPKPKNFRKRR